eukprot:4961457-Pyramimonas_sp.AAC.1
MEKLQCEPLTLAPAQNPPYFPPADPADTVGSATAASSSAGSPPLAAPAPHPPRIVGDAGAPMRGDSDVGRPKARALASPVMPAPDEIAEHDLRHLCHIELGAGTAWRVEARPASIEPPRSTAKSQCFTKITASSARRATSRRSRAG